MYLTRCDHRTRYNAVNDLYGSPRSYLGKVLGSTYTPRYALRALQAAMNDTSTFHGLRIRVT
jgi:hypothetical protein